MRNAKWHKILGLTLAAAVVLGVCTYNAIWPSGPQHCFAGQRRALLNRFIKHREGFAYDRTEKQWREGEFLSTAADPLFQMAAACFSSRVLGAGLTGCDGDGTRGLRAIKKYGGPACPADAAFHRAHAM